MIFNNTNFDNLFKILNIRRSLIPNISHNMLEFSGRDGSTSLSKSKLEVGRIEVDIEVKSENRETKREDMRILAGLLFTREEEKLRFKDEPDKYYMAKLDGNTNLEEFYIYGVTTLSFACGDPIAYGQTIKHNISDETTIYISCTEEVSPVFKFNIDKATSSVKILNQGNGKYVLINHNFNVGDKLEIIFNDKWKVRNNGIVIAEKVTISSDFFNLHPGENNIKIEPSTLTAELEYIERWL